MHTDNLTLSSVSLENTPELWEKNDILIFFIDLDNHGLDNRCPDSLCPDSRCLDSRCLDNYGLDYFDTLSAESLSNSEKRDLEKLQTSYFKKRFIVSRISLKHIICTLFKIESIQDVSTYKDRYGEVRISGHEDLHICLSYSEKTIALAISKFKIGIDIENKRPLELKNTLKYLCKQTLCAGNSADCSDLLNIWTVKEAYCKYSNINMLSFLNKEPDLNNISYSNLLLDGKYIFSIITESGRHKISINYLNKFL